MYEFMLALSLVVFLSISVYYARHPAASFFHPMTFYLMFHGLVFVVRPVFAWAYDFHVMYDVIGFQPTIWHKTTALICANLSLVVFTAVCMSIGKQPLQFQQPTVGPDERAAMLRNFWPVAIVMAACGMWAVISGLQTMATTDINDIRQYDARSGATYLVGANGYFINMALMLVSLSAIIVYLGRFRLWSLAIFGLYAAMKLGTGGRGQVVTCAVMITLFYLFDHRRKWPGFAIVLAAACGWLVFDQIGADRGAGIREAIGIQEERPSPVRSGIEEKPLETMDLANMEFLEYYVWAIPEKTGSYNYFVHNLQLLTEPIPRALWPGKPIGPPIKMYELYRYAIPIGITSSVAGSGWAAMGYLGVMIWSAVFAALYGGAHRMLTRSSGSNLAVITYVVFVSTSVIAFRDGGLMTILKALQFYFVPVACLAAVVYFLKSSVPAGANQYVLGSASGDARSRRRRLAEAVAQTRALSFEVGPERSSLDSPRNRRRMLAADL